MFVLQECSICFDDFGLERYPHCVPCGHIFCSPCLESLLSSSTTARCPNCRVPYASDSIRKLICTHQDPAPNPQTTEPGELEAETLMWDAIQRAVDSPEEHEQRRSLVESNSPKADASPAMSTSLSITLSVMNLLVQVEEKNRALEDELSTAQAVEQSLCDRISTLEDQACETNPQPGTSATQDLRKLMAGILEIQSAIKTIGKDTSKVARHFGEGPDLAPSPTVTQSSQPGGSTPTDDLGTSPPNSLTASQQSPSQAADRSNKDQDVPTTPVEPRASPSGPAIQPEASASNTPCHEGNNLSRPPRTQSPRAPGDSRRRRAHRAELPLISTQGPRRLGFRISPVTGRGYSIYAQN